MKKTLLTISLVALTANYIPAAHAGDREDFKDCDGLKKPKKNDDGMRGVAKIRTNALLRDPSAYYRATAIGIVSGCERALKSKKLLPAHTLRRAHLLRAKAAANIQLGKTFSAQNDLNEAKLVSQKLTNDPFFKRSMGTSFMLLDAAIAAKKGENEKAFMMASQASELRPYATKIQYAAAVIMHSIRPIGESSPQPWNTLLKLTTEKKDGYLFREVQIGNFEGVLKIADNIEMDWPQSTPRGRALFSRTELGWTEALFTRLHIAYAFAASGKADEATRYLNFIEQKLEKVAALSKVPPITAGKEIEFDSAEAKAEFEEKAKKSSFAIVDLDIKMYNIFKKIYVTPFVDATNARIALSNGDRAPAKLLLQGKEPPKNSITLDLITTLNAGQEEVENIELKNFILKKIDKMNSTQFAEIATKSLIALERESQIVDYKKSKIKILSAFAKGNNRTDGFNSKVNEDGSTTIEFLGKTVSASLVQEMTILRAAEITKQAGEDKFIITKRSDNARFQVKKQYNTEISRIATGYKTILNIRYPNENETNDRSFNADQVIADLGPIYYDET